MAPQEYEVEIEKFSDIASDMRRFVLHKPAGFSFQPGQYGLFSFPGGGLSRPFTFSSSPRDEFLEISVKRMGEFTGMLFEAKKGDRLRLKAPLGETLVFKGDESEDIALIAGGSGITPFISILRYARQLSLTNRFTLLYGNQTLESIPRVDEVTNEWWENLSVVHILSKEKRDGYEHGHITKELITGKIPAPTSRRWYVCGPPAMNQAILSALHEIGAPAKLIHEEQWQLPGKHDQ